MAKVDLFLSLEESISNKLLPKWEKTANRIAKQLSDAVQRDDYKAIEEILYSFNTDGLLKSELKFMKQISVSALLFGAANVAGSARNTQYVKDGGTPEIIAPAMNQLKLLMGEADSAIRKNLEQAVLRAQESMLSDTVQKAARIRDIDDFMGKRARGAGAGMINLTSSLHTSRLSSYGFTVESQVRGFTRYQINEQLDNRSCPVCREMHGRTFDVNVAFQKLDRLLKVDSPADLKALAPWPKQDAESVARLRTMSEAELAGAGWDTPPFHPLCRGLLGKTEVQDVSQTVFDDPPPVVRRPATQPVPEGAEPQPVPRTVNPATKEFEGSEDWYRTFNDSTVDSDDILENFPDDTAGKIRDVNARLKTVLPTDKEFRIDGVWTAKRAELHQEIIDEILSDENIRRATPLPGETPEYLVFGGRGGSGKSKFTDPVEKGGLGIVDKKRFIVMDSDEIKGMLPEYNPKDGWNAFQVHEESSYLFDRISDLAHKQNLNVVHDMTLKSTGSAIKRVSAFKDSGYKVGGYYMHLPRQEAAKRAVSRFLGDSKRYVPIDVVLSNTTNETTWAAILDKLDDWSFYDNQVERGALPRLVGKK